MLDEIEDFEIFENPEMVFDIRARDWCLMSFPSNQKGCSRYGNNPDCPPKAPLLHDFVSFNKMQWLLIVKFNLKKQADRMKKRHPNWTEKQCRCSRYWQGAVHKYLKDIFKDMNDKNDLVFTLKPEAMGLNVFATLRRLKIPIKKNPQDTVYKVALVGYPNGVKEQSRIDNYD